MGSEVRIFDPAGVPLPDATLKTHPKVQELREAPARSEGWCGPRPVGMVNLIWRRFNDEEVFQRISSRCARLIAPQATKRDGAATAT